MSQEKKVGAFLVATALLACVLVEVGGHYLPFRRLPRYTTKLSTVTGLKLGDPVRMGGVDVGHITGIGLKAQKVEVAFETAPGVVLHRGCEASLRLTNLLGGQFLSLSFGDADAPVVASGAELPGRDSANVDVIIDNVAELASEARSLVKSLNTNQQRVLGLSEAMLAENRSVLRQAVGSLASVAAKVDRGDGSLGRLLNDGTLYSKAEQAVAGLARSAQALDSSEGALGLLLHDPALYRQALVAVNDADAAARSAGKAADSAAAVLGRIERGEGTAGRLVTDAALYDDLRAVAANLKVVSAQISSGKGTLGRLVAEDQLYRDTAVTLKKVERAADSLSDSGPISVLGSILGTLF